MLQERFSKLEFVGMILALFGAFIISYKLNTNFKDMFINGSQYVLFSSLFAAISAVIIKKK